MKDDLGPKSAPRLPVGFLPRPRQLAFLLLSSFLLAAGAQAQEQTVLFDFGKHDNGANGAVVSTALLNTNSTNFTAVGPGTAIGDTVSYVWNSVGNASGVNQTGTYSQFRDQNSNAVSWILRDVITDRTEGNGFQTGGLKLVTNQAKSVNPTNAFLGKLAVPDATGDFWFVNHTLTNPTVTITNRAGFRLTNLDTAKRYRFTVFGSRNATDSRFTYYQIAGSNTVRGSLQTSGTDIGAGNGVGTDTNKYDGNDARTLTLPAVTPATNGTIFLTWLGRNDTNFPVDFSATNAANSLGYLNLMQVEVFPDGYTTYLVDIGGDASTVASGDGPTPSTNGIFWNNSSGSAYTNTNAPAPTNGLLSNPVAL